MRLIRLKIRNIASLKGEHEIDFSEIERGSPLFAITGETGSGKSSILNSIGLALYGEIYKKNVNQVDVVTLGEKDGSIELIFQVKGNYYLADWKARVLKQNGEPYSTPQSPVRTLYKLEGKDFSSPKTATTTTATELLNLDFEQYCRCIILNQGEFARFLNSTFKDRRDILEKLYPGEMLENISRELEGEKKLLEKTKQEIDIQLSTLRGDNESGEELKKQKELFEKELKVFEAEASQVESLHQSFTSVYSYYEKHHANEKSKDKIRETLEIETSRYNQILKSGEALQERYDKAKRTQDSELPLLETYLKKEETLRLLEEGWKNHQKKFQELESRLAETSVKLNDKRSHERNYKHNLQGIEFQIPVEALKTSKHLFDDFFDSFSEIEILNEELKGKKERLLNLETTGKEIKALVSEIETKLSGIPLDAEERKKDLSEKIEKKRLNDLKAAENAKLISTGKETVSRLRAELTKNDESISLQKKILDPIEATLKLQQIFSAKEICIDHALTVEKDHCPVCERPADESIWAPLKKKLVEMDMKSLKLQFDEGSKTLQKLESGIELLKQKIVSEEKEITDRENQLKQLASPDGISISDLALELENVSKLSWQQDSLKKDLAAKQLELQKFRDQYVKLKNELSQLEKSQEEKSSKLAVLSEHFKSFLPVVSKETVRDLRIEVRKLTEYLTLETQLDKLQQEIRFLENQINDLRKESEGYKVNEEAELSKITLLKEELSLALKGESASTLIARIKQEARSSQEEWERHLEVERKQANSIKESQGRLHQLTELSRDFELHFTKELHSLREKARENSLTEFAVLEKLDLTFESPEALFVPIKDFLTEKRESTKTRTNECRMNLASARTKFSEWEKLQDKIQLLELKSKDVSLELGRKLRLFEVLGKDELRTFVLSLVEEHLIQQTNEELQKLCQGRYEIVHQTKSLKMTPEFYILDKFREGGRRKVSTLSGGETFMVSLAMALGLAEMTRGQAEIDSLFIDEGFGTLDQESLEDVLDMLQQIQNRGLMVGVISHIKTLTGALPVNLVVNKKQDGVSSVSIRYN